MQDANGLASLSADNQPKNPLISSMISFTLNATGHPAVGVSMRADLAHAAADDDESSAKANRSRWHQSITRAHHTNPAHALQLISPPQNQQGS